MLFESTYGGASPSRGTSFVVQQSENVNLNIKSVVFGLIASVGLFTAAAPSHAQIGVVIGVPAPAVFTCWDVYGESYQVVEPCEAYAGLMVVRPAVVVVRPFGWHRPAAWVVRPGYVHRGPVVRGPAPRDFHVRGR